MHFAKKSCSFKTPGGLRKFCARSLEPLATFHIKPPEAAKIASLKLFFKISRLVKSTPYKF